MKKTSKCGHAISCAAKHCTNNRMNCKITYFTFPNDVERARQWAVQCSREDLLEMPVKALYNHYRVCAIHFEGKMFLNDLKNRLQPHAVPTIFHNNQADFSSSSEAEEPSFMTPDNIRSVLWTMSKVNNYSDDEDDPAVFESSGDEWDTSMEMERKLTNRRISKRLSKKPRVTHTLDDSSDSSISDIGEAKMRPKNGMNKKQKISDNGTAGSDTKTTRISRKFLTPKLIYSEDFSTGSFVILKKDAQVGDPSKHPCIWRIDGKALLQKYEAYDCDGIVRHKNTSIYTGWSPLDKDLYAPVAVDVIQHTSQNFIVELHWDKLKEINMDSD